MCYILLSEYKIAHQLANYFITIMHTAVNLHSFVCCNQLHSLIVLLNQAAVRLLMIATVQ